MQKKTNMIHGNEHCLQLGYVFLIACSLFASGVNATRAAAQECYIQTNDFAYGNFFVKAISDSTCFGQYSDNLYYQNYKTREIYFRFSSREHYALPIALQSQISDILLFDSLLVVNWEDGEVFRILKVDYTGRVSEVPSILDEMPMLKYRKGAGSNDSRKIRKVHDSLFIMSHETCIYSFVVSGDLVQCVDSLSKYDSYRGIRRFDIDQDTLVLLSRSEMQVESYYISENGKFEYLKAEQVIGDFPPGNVVYAHGNIYISDTNLDVFIKTDSGFVYEVGPWYFVPLGPLILPRGIAQLDFFNYDKFDIYDPELNFICSKLERTSLSILSCSNFGEKIFIARSDGITTWIPDTSTTAVRNLPLVGSPNAFEIYPNPSTSGSITVYSEEPIHRVRITDVIGRIMYDNSKQATQSETISTIGFNSGVYFIELQTATGPSLRKIVVVQE